MRRAAAAALLLAGTAPAVAQNAAAGETAPIEPPYFEIVKLSVGDELNLRANASPTGMMIGRLPAGSIVKNLGCAEVKKNRWCKVADVNKESLQGWAAARYLVATQYEEPEQVDTPVEGTGDAGSYPDIDNGGASILPD